MIVSDSRIERTSNAMPAWLGDADVTWDHNHIAPGEPPQNGVVENFNCRIRDDLLNETEFSTID